MNISDPEMNNLHENKTIVVMNQIGKSPLSVCLGPLNQGIIGYAKKRDDKSRTRCGIRRIGFEYGRRVYLSHRR